LFELMEVMELGRIFMKTLPVFHHFTEDNKIRLREGMIFTIEPMINMGKSYAVETSSIDGWTVTTVDGSISAQFEHTVLVTSEGSEILTKLPNSKV